MLLKKRRWIAIIAFIPLVFVSLFMTSKGTNIIDYFFSVIDPESDVGDSNILLRFNQLISCFYVTDNLYFGNGYNWASYYLQTFGDHPLLFAFESKIFSVLCNSGLIGGVIWIMFLFCMYKYQTDLFKKGFDRYRILLCFFWAFQSYICFTGDYGYTYFWLLFYSFFIVNMRILNANNNCKCYPNNVLL